jgi:hypothetical protein
VLQELVGEPHLLVLAVELHLLVVLKPPIQVQQEYLPLVQGYIDLFFDISVSH